METQKEKLVRYLDDAWAVEKALVTQLQDLADDVNIPEVREALLEHRQVTHDQEERLEARIRALGAEPSGGKSFMNNLLGKVGDILNAGHDRDDRTTQGLIKGFAIENLETAMYKSLKVYANEIGDTETANLAEKLQKQEKEAADKVWGFISQAAKQPARQLATAGV